MWNSKTVSVILPTLNEKDSIRSAIQTLFETGVVDEVVVVNNNAVQGTSEEVAKTKAREVKEPRQGYGCAIRRGLQEACGGLVILSEPDGTFLGRDILKLLAFEADFDVVLGSRTVQQFIWKGANMGFFLRTGNWAVAKLIQLLFNTPSLSDVGCTLRLISRKALDVLLPQLRIGGSHFSVEFILGSFLSGFRMVQVPVNYLPRIGVSSATGRTSVAIAVGLRMIAYIFSQRLRPRFHRQSRREIFPMELAACPSCGASRSEPFREVPCPDGRPPYVFRAVRCPGCQLVYLDPRPDAVELSSFYGGSYYGAQTGPGGALYQRVSCFFARRRRLKIERFRRPGRLLDVGCGTGGFLREMEAGGWEVAGVEPNPDAEASADPLVRDRIEFCDL